MQTRTTSTEYGIKEMTETGKKISKRHTKKIVETQTVFEHLNNQS